jgi:hypothetical protein
MASWRSSSAVGPSGLLYFSCKQQRKQRGRGLSQPLCADLLLACRKQVEQAARALDTCPYSWRDRPHVNAA